MDVVFVHLTTLVFLDTFPDIFCFLNSMHRCFECDDNYNCLLPLDVNKSGMKIYLGHQFN